MEPFHLILPQSSTHHHLPAIWTVHENLNNTQNANLKFPTPSVSNCRLARTAYPFLIIAINGWGHGAKPLSGGRRPRRSRETLSALFSHGCCTTELQISSSWRRMRCENSEKKPHYIQRWLKAGTIRTADYIHNRARTHGRLLSLQRIW